MEETKDGILSYLEFTDSYNLRKQIESLKKYVNKELLTEKGHSSFKEVENSSKEIGTKIERSQNSSGELKVLSKSDLAFKGLVPAEGCPIDEEGYRIFRGGCMKGKYIWTTTIISCMGIVFIKGDNIAFIHHKINEFGPTNLEDYFKTLNTFLDSDEIIFYYIADDYNKNINQSHESNVEKFKNVFSPKKVNIIEVKDLYTMKIPDVSKVSFGDKLKIFKSVSTEAQKRDGIFHGSPKSKFMVYFDGSSEISFGNYKE